MGTENTNSPSGSLELMIASSLLYPSLGSWINIFCLLGTNNHTWPLIEDVCLLLKYGATSSLGILSKPASQVSSTSYSIVISVQQLLDHAICDCTSEFLYTASPLLKNELLCCIRCYKRSCSLGPFTCFFSELLASNIPVFLLSGTPPM